MLPPPYQCVLSIKIKQIQIWLKRSMCVDSHSQNCLINTNIETNINNNQQIVSVVSKEYVHKKTLMFHDQLINTIITVSRIQNIILDFSALSLELLGTKRKWWQNFKLWSAWGAGVKVWRVKIWNHNFERFWLWFLDQELDLLWWAFPIIWSRI